MKGKTLTEKIVSEFKKHLALEEKSPVTIEKYIRDVTAFMVFLSSRPVLKDVVIECSGIPDHLNGDFLNCFTEEEKLRITVHDTDLGKAFLLSTEEVRKYFGDDDQYDKPNLSYEDLYYDYDKFVRDGIRAGKIAEYQGVATDWWLRNVGSYGPYIVDAFGETYSQSDDNIAGIRPAMWIKLIDTGYSQTTINTGGDAGIGEDSIRQININEVLLSDIGHTYGDIRKKYGEGRNFSYLEWCEY